MRSFDLTTSTNVVKLRFAAISCASVLVLASLYLCFHFNQQLRILPGTYIYYTRGQPASKLPHIFNTHQLSQEELAIKSNVTSDTTCGGIDVNSILHVKAAAIIDPDLDVFLNESDNYPQIGLPPSTWEDKEERAYWAYLNSVALWRPRSRTYWTINRIVYFKDRNRYYSPLISYAWWQEWNEAGTQRVGSGRLPIFIPQHRAKGGSEGPEDPRPFEDPNGNICFVFSMLDIDGLFKMWMYNTTSERQVALHPPDGRETQRVEKNWTPFVHDDKVKFVFSYKPVTIIACDFSSGACHFDYAEENNPGISELRGGSNWVPWYDSGYYLAFAHTRISKDFDFYRLHLVVLSANDELFRIAYASGPLDLNNITLLEPLGIHRNVSEMDERELDHGLLLLSGSVTRTDLFDRDSILITVSTSDNSTTLLEIGGISDVMEAVIGKAEREASWHIDDGKVVECAERAASKHYDDVFMKYDAQSKRDHIGKRGE